MASAGDPMGEGYCTTEWSLQSFAFGDFIPEEGCELRLDRASSEFGLLYRLGHSAEMMAQFPDNNEPVFFHAMWVIAACHRPNGSCKKVSVLLSDYQIDLEFTHPTHAQDFLVILKSLAANTFTLHEVPTNVAFQRKDFDMVKLGYGLSGIHVWGIVSDPMIASINQLWYTKEWSDFIVVAGSKEFKVHKSIVCPRSEFFANACKPGFMENINGYINLEEDEVTVEALLAEIYGVENPVTGSLFTTFALKHDIEKEAIMNTLLKLFIACDKYNLDFIKGRAVEAFVDRLQLILDPLVTVDLATVVYDSCPENDLGLRATIIEYIVARFPAIHGDDSARKELQHNTVVLDALHDRFSEIIAQGVLTTNPKSSSPLLTPPQSPVKGRKATGMTLRSSAA